MLGRDEKNALIGALKIWASTVPNRRVLGSLGGDFLTPMQIVDAAINETEDGKVILEMLEHGIRREGLQAVAERLPRRYGSTGTEPLQPLTR